MTKADISKTEDIASLIDLFYTKVKKDEVIGYFFTDVIPFNWETHIPVMISFWDTVLLGAKTYQGNPMIKHLNINKIEALKPVHFTRWRLLWDETINEHFEGPVANEAMRRAAMMEELMLFKIDQSNSSYFIQ